MAPNRKKRESTTAAAVEKSQESGPAMFTRSRTYQQPCKGNGAVPPSLPDTRRKRSNAALDGRRHKATGSSAKATRRSERRAPNTLAHPLAAAASEGKPSHQLNFKKLANSGTWGILRNVKDTFPRILLKGEKFTIGRENCDWNIKELPENEVLCTIKMWSEQDTCHYSILSHSVSHLLKLNDLILRPDEEKPLTNGDVICWSLETACFHVFFGTAHANCDAQEHCSTQACLEDPTGAVGGEGKGGGGGGDAFGDNVAHNLLCVNNLLLGTASHEEEDLSSKKGTPIGPLTKTTLPAALGAMEIDDSPDQDLMDNLKRLGKMIKATNKTITAAEAIVAAGNTTNSKNNSNNNNNKEDNQMSPVSVIESIKERIVSSDDIEFSFGAFPYYLSEKVQERLMCITTVYFTHQEFVPFVQNIEALNRRVLLTGPSGTSRCMAAIVAAVAKDNNADLLTFNWDLVLAEGDDENEEDGAGDEALDDYDFYEDFDRRLSNTAENLNFAFGTSRKSTKRGRSKVSSPRPDHERMVYAAPRRAILTAGMTGATAPKLFRKGDRVIFTGSSTNAKQSASSRNPNDNTATGSTRKGSGAEGNTAAGAEGVQGPRIGTSGRVVVTFAEEPQRVGVCFDAAVPGGTKLNEQCESGHGYFCDSADLKLDNSSKRNGQENMIIDSFFEVAQQAATKKPLVIHIQDAELSVLGKSERLARFKRRLEALQGNVVVIGTTIREQKKDSTSAGLFSKFGSHPSAMLEFGFFEKLGKADDKSANKAENTKSAKMLSKLFPNHLCIVPPINDPELTEWKKAIERDTELLNEESNRRLMSSAIQKCNAVCPELEKIAVRDAQMPSEDIDELIGLSVAQRLRQSTTCETQEGKLIIGRDDIERGSVLVKGFQEEPAPTKGDLHDVVTDNEFEKRLLAEVVPPSEVGVGFDDIGALETVKKTLQEIVMLPLQRPELFARGQLLKPTKGVLLFGPPGTGKTMLAKAVAAESGANFMNMSVSSIASKWFGEGEKYVRALFSLAHKISPCVIFVDEVDSLLGRRDKANEHEAMRKIKNEFMANWDGLRTNERDRVLVLAATNRPMDLDEAVIRRMPRRLLVDLPDAENRIKILKTILRHEDIHPEFSYDEIAAVTDGYSGSDLKNLCLEAALHPVRDYLKHEETQPTSSTAEPEAPVIETSAPMDIDGKLVLSLVMKKSGSSKGPAAKKAKTVRLRPIDTEDVLDAARQIASSVSNDALSMTEIRNWNQMYGEGGNRQKTPLSYFM